MKKFILAVAGLDGHGGRTGVGFFDAAPLRPCDL